MSQSLLRENLILNLKDFFREHSSEYYVDMAFLYGSWAQGYPRIDSDIDLGIVFSSEMGCPDKLFSLITDLAYKLQEVLRLEVNIIHIREDFDKPMLYYNAVVLGTPLFIKDFDKFIDLKLEAISQMEDFSIFGIPWQLEIAKNALRR